MTDRAINPDALVAVVNNLADELDAVLALGADPAAVGRVNDLTDRLNDLLHALAYASASFGIVRDLQRRLGQRAVALVEVHSLPMDAIHPDVWYGNRAVLREFGPRFAPPADEPTDEDIPF